MRLAALKRDGPDADARDRIDDNIYYYFKFDFLSIFYLEPKFKNFIGNSVWTAWSSKQNIFLEKKLKSFLLSSFEYFLRKNHKKTC